MCTCIMVVFHLSILNYLIILWNGCHFVYNWTEHTIRAVVWLSNHIKDSKTFLLSLIWLDSQMLSNMNLGCC